MTNKIFKSIAEAAEYYGMNKYKNNISACCKGKVKTCGKYNGQKLKWAYIETTKL